MTALCERPARSASTSRCRRSCSSRTWPRPPASPIPAARGSRRGANIGRTREIWPTRRRLRLVRAARRQGPGAEPRDPHEARRRRRCSRPTRSLNRDWNDVQPEHRHRRRPRRRSRSAVAEYFSRHTMQELYDIACKTNLMLAPANSPREIYASAQLAARDFFGPVGDVARFPRSFVVIALRRRPGRTACEPVAAARVVDRAAFRSVRIARDRRNARTPARGRDARSSSSARARPGRSRRATSSSTARRCCASSRRHRPDFLRASLAVARQPARARRFGRCTTASTSASATSRLNLKQPGRGRLREAPRRGVGRRGRGELRAARDEGLRARLRRAGGDQARSRDDQRVPQRPDRPAQGLPRLRRAGLRARRVQRPHRLARPRTGRPLRHHHRLARAALTSPPRSRPGSCYRRRTGNGVYLDISQVESANWSLSPWLLDYEIDGVIRLRDGNRHAPMCPHGAFPCADEGDVGDRWVAIACHSDPSGPRSPTSSASAKIRGSLRSPVARTARTRSRRTSRLGPRPAPGPRSPSSCRPSGSRRFRSRTSAISTTIRNSRYREHFEPHTHPFLGPGLYERNGFRLPEVTERVRPIRSHAGPGHRLGAPRAARIAPTPRSTALRASGAVE